MGVLSCSTSLGIPTSPGVWTPVAALGREVSTPVRVRAVSCREVCRPVRRGGCLRVDHPQGEQESAGGVHRGQYERG